MPKQLLQENPIRNEQIVNCGRQLFGAVQKAADPKADVSN